jgi:small subunit ribosomal protein S7e
MFLPHLRKLRKAKRSNPSPLENDVAKALYDLELHHKTLRSHLPRFHVNTAKQVEGKITTKKAIVVFYPLRYLKLVRKIQTVLTAELEKRFSGQIVALVAQRKVTRRPTGNIYALQQVQRSTTRTAVNESILEDLIYPADIVGRRWRFRVDGSKLMKVYLDSELRKRMDSRLPLIAAIYKKLTQRSVSFGYMWNPRLQQISTR